MTLPLALLTLLVFAGLDWNDPLAWRTLTQIIGLALAWLTYWFVLNEELEQSLLLAVVAIILIQSAVAVSQFWLQRDIGLSALGEPVLDPSQPGVSIIAAGDRGWLRGYGLTAHPNLLGATLAPLLLLVISWIPHSRNAAWAHSRTLAIALWLVVAIGLAGLLVSFSRAAWLGFACGFAFYLAVLWKNRRQTKGGGSQKRSLTALLAVAAPVLVVLIFILVYSDLVVGRLFRLDHPLEITSLRERLRSVRMALRLISDAPLLGVGAGNFLAESTSLDPGLAPLTYAVHNIPLLVAAELGLLGAFLCLWLALASFVEAARAEGQKGATRFSVVSGATLSSWVALIVIGLFDITLWLTTSWRAAILFALLAALACPQNQRLSARRPLGQ